MILQETIQVQGNYHRFEFITNGENSFKLFMCSDVHFDNPKCNRELFFKHLDKAVKMGAYIAINGDFFCMMQGKYDRRSNKNAILPQHNKDDYFDQVINEAVDLMSPYANRILIMSQGNHETAVSAKAEMNMLKIFIERLNQKNGSNVQRGEYMGYYTISLGNANGGKKVTKIAYSHGHWGGAVSKGTQSVGRYSSMFPQADIVTSGHVHELWVVAEPRYELNTYKQKVEVTNQWHVKTGTYKEEFEGGKGWAVEKIAKPKALGGVMCEIIYNSHHDLVRQFTIWS